MDLPVRDGDKIQAGTMEFTVVDLPGHTRCSIAYFLEEEGLLLACETAGVFDGVDTIIPSYLVGYGLALDSIRKMTALPIKQILLPHFGLLDGEKTAFYLQNAEKSAVKTAETIVKILQNGGSHQDAMDYFKKEFYNERIAPTYPVDAMELNTSIMIRLLEKELLGAENR